MKVFALRAVLLLSAFSSSISYADDQASPDEMEIEIGTVYSHTVEADDTNYYVFTPTEAATYTVALTKAPTYIDWYMEEKADDQMYWFCYPDYPEENPEGAVCDVQLKAGATYLLKVREWEGVPVSYRILVSKKTQA